MFKSLILTSCFLCFTSVQAYSQDSTKSKSSTVYFLRSTGYAGMGAFSVFIDESLACHLNNNSYSIHTVAPGLHKFQVRFNGDAPKKKFKTLDIQMEAGQTYYISVGATNHYLTSTIELIEVTVNTAKKQLPLLKPDTNCE